MFNQKFYESNKIYNLKDNVKIKKIIRENFIRDITKFYQII